MSNWITNFDSFLSLRIVLGFASCDVALEFRQTKVESYFNSVNNPHVSAGRAVEWTELGSLTQSYENAALFTFLPRLTAALKRRAAGSRLCQKENKHCDWRLCCYQLWLEHDTFSWWSPGGVCVQQMWFALVVWTHVLHFCWGYFPRFPQEGNRGI